MTAKNDLYKVAVTHQKIYTDDLGKAFPNTLFDDVEQVNIKSYWPGAVDAFYKYNHTNWFMCLNGDLRIVIAYPEGNEQYKFHQYFLSGMDGKMVRVDEGVMLGINVLGNQPAMLWQGYDEFKVSYERSSSKIFYWNAKR
jgi:dTDP-4-dehydrorhamnose 3,5-epimerase-like enzyme